jgi:phage host-nuclease inhibitor protein Gam
MAAKHTDIVHVPADTDEADTFLRRMAKIDRKTKWIDDDLIARIAALQASAALRLKKLKQERTELILGLHEFAKYSRRTLFTSKKSVRLSHGTIGWRRIKKEEQFFAKPDSLPPDTVPRYEPSTPVKTA